jgi:hypothetical protein
VKAATRQVVRQRAGNRYEYCRLHQDDDPLWPFHIEHILARQHGGTDNPASLALACHECNLRKGPNLAGVDPMTQKKTWLFNPRQQKWSRHFRWQGTNLIGRTAVGRATIATLGINLPDRVVLRQLLIKAGSVLPND